MKQLKKTLLTLVALLAVTTGAWADGSWTSGDCTVTLSGGTLTVSGNGEMYGDYDDVDEKAPWVSSASSITSLVIEDGVTYIGDYAFYNLSALTSVTFGKDVANINIHAFDKCTSLTEFTFPASVKKIEANVLNNCTNLTEVTILATDLERMFNAPFYKCGNLKTINIYAETPCVINSTTFSDIANLEHIYVPAGSVNAYQNALNWTNVASYIAAMPAQASSGTPVNITWDAATRTATFTQPAGNVMVTASYYDVAEFADNGEPKAETGVLANTDAPLVSAGVVKNIGNSTTPMGTVMYCVKQQTGNTAPTAPDYNDEGWTDEVPTADGLVQGTYYVWYYIKGAEPANIADRNDQNTCNDTPIFVLGSTGFVEVGPEPSYTVELADATTEATNWKAGKNNETPTAFPLEGVKKGDKVTVKYEGQRKVIGVKAEKKAGPKTYTELNGGEVLHVGDILNFSDANVSYSFGGYNLKPSNCPFTVLRANITGAQFNPTATPADDGEYYVMQAKGGDYYFAGKNLPATATSDGLLITINSVEGNYKYGTISVLEPKVYDSGEIDLRTLEVGDILREGITLNDNTNNSDQLALEVGRYAKTFNNKTTTPTTRQSFDTDQIGAIGENGQIVDEDLGTFTPLSAAGKACTEWIVLAIEDVNIPQYSLNYKKVVVGGYRDPNIVDIDPVAGKTNEWVLDMPASNVVLTPRYASATIFDADDAEKQAYETLKEAIQNVQNGETIVLDWDVTITAQDEPATTKTTQGGVKFTIDFNGHTIDGLAHGTEGCIILNNEGDEITFIDSSTNQADQAGGLKGVVNRGNVDNVKVIFDGGCYNFGDINLTAAILNNLYSGSNSVCNLADGKEFIDIENAADDGFRYYVDYKTFELTIGAGRFDTFYDTQNVTLDAETPAGVGLYTISSINADRTEATVVALADPIAAAGTPFLVYNGTADKLTVKLKVTPTNPSNSQMHAAAFQGTAVDKTFDDDMMAAYDYYALSGGKIFVPVYEKGTLGKNQCWLEFAKSAGAPARGITLVFEESETTEITTTDVTDETDGAWYDLSGRKLDGEPTTKGVYVKDGKKVVVK